MDEIDRKNLAKALWLLSEGDTEGAKILFSMVRNKKEAKRVARRFVEVLGK